MGVVVLSSLAAGLGSIGTIGFGGIIFGTVAALDGWISQTVILMLLFSLLGGPPPPAL